MAHLGQKEEAHVANADDPASGGIRCFNCNIYVFFFGQRCARCNKSGSHGVMLN